MPTEGYVWVRGFEGEYEINDLGLIRDVRSGQWVAPAEKPATATTPARPFVRLWTSDGEPQEVFVDEIVPKGAPVRRRPGPTEFKVGSDGVVTVEEETEHDPDLPQNYESLTVELLRQIADARHITLPAKINKADLVQMLRDYDAEAR